MNVFCMGWKNFLSLWTSKKYCCIKGRAKRSEYWSTLLIVVLLGIGASILDLIISIPLAAGLGVGSTFFSTVFGLALILPLITLQVRRLHDSGKSGAWVFAQIAIEAVCLIMLILLLISLGLGYYGISETRIDEDVLAIIFASNMFGLLFLNILIWIGWLAMEITLFVFTLLPSQRGVNRYGECPVQFESKLIEAPVETVTPAAPVAPVAPAEPSAPVAPVAPAEPVAPVVQDKPADSKDEETEKVEEKQESEEDKA